MRFIVAALLGALLLPTVAAAQALAPLHPLQPADTSSPAATLGSLIDSCNDLHRLLTTDPATDPQRSKLATTERILDCLNLTELPNELQNSAGIESALFLKEVLDRIKLPAKESIPSVDDAESEDGDPLLKWRIPGTRITIARVETGPRQGAYQFAAETVRRAAQFYGMVKDLPYRTDGPPVSPGLYDAHLAATKMSVTQTADTSSPRGTLTLFLDACNELHERISKERYFDRRNPDYDQMGLRIISCLDTSQLPEYSREYFDAEAAVCLKEVLDRIPLPAAEKIPGVESTQASDGTEPIVRWQIPGTQIVLARMEKGPRRGEFLFTAETVSRAPEFYEKIISQPYRSDGPAVSNGFYQWWLSSPGNPTVASLVDLLPQWFQRRGWGMAIWQWLGLLLAIPVGLTLMLLLIRMGRARSAQSRERSLLRYWLSLSFPLLAMLIPLGFRHFAWEYLTLRGSALYVVGFCVNVLFMLGAIVLIVVTSSRVADTIIAHPRIASKGLDASLIRIICRVLGIAAAIIVLLEGGRSLGFPLTTLIASAGIGGLAIALSAQGLIKGLFGTVTILLDKPYRVGDRIVVKGHDGVVEEIGLRSTKIRALTNHLISVPNDQMADAEIENVGKRTFIRRVSNLHIPIDTPLEQLEEAIACIRSLLENHEGMEAEPRPSVYFTEFNADSFNIRISYCYAPALIWKYHAFSEKINLTICKEFEARGIQFSLPLRHSYWKKDDQQGPLEVQLTNNSDEG